jgi:hypothetical protein
MSQKKKMKFTPSMISRVKQLYLEGKSLSEIGQSCNITHRQVRYVLMKYCKYQYVPEKVNGTFFTKYPGGKVQNAVVVELKNTTELSDEEKYNICKEVCADLTKRLGSFRRHDLNLYLQNTYGADVFSTAFLRKFLRVAKTTGLACTTQHHPNGHNIVWLGNETTVVKKAAKTKSNIKKPSVEKQQSKHKRFSILWGLFKFEY